MRNTAKYVWPASALTASEMALLHAARETSSPRLPITGLIAGAVRAAYGRRQAQTETTEPRNKETLT